MDYFAVVSMGAYPTPGVTTTQRAAYAGSYGLLGLLATTTVSGRTSEGLGRLRMGMKMN